MTRVRAWLAVGLIGLAWACAPGPDEKAFPNGPLERVSLSRGGCLGSCSVYAVEILGDGRARYQGDRFVVIEGRRDVLVSPELLSEVLAAAKTADLYRLEDAYAGGPTDGATYEVSVTVGGRTKTITDYNGQLAGMPPAVTALERAIDRAAGTGRWVKGDESTLAILQAEGFDFGSPQAFAMLHQVLRRGPENLALALIAGGALKDQTAKDRALWLAALYGRATLIAPLVKAGARVDAPGPDRSALFAAASAGSDSRTADGAATVRALLAAGANPRAVDSQGVTPLHEAADAPTVRALIAAGADPDARTREDVSPLLYRSREDAVLALLEAGADPTVRDGAGDDLARNAEVRRWSRVQAWLRAHPQPAKAS